MRVAPLGISLLLYSTSAFAQTGPCGSQAFSYDPYKPSEIAIVRNFGGTLFAQAPLSELLKLDPYVPSQGQLLRQAGGGIPLWMAYPWHPAPPSPVINVVANCAGPSEAAAPPAVAPAPLSKLSDVLAVLPRDPAPAAMSPTLTPSQRATGQRTQGISINYAGRTWVSAGRAVPHRDAEFVRTGESAGVPVFRRADAKDDVIYVPTIEGMVAPFRMTR